MSSLYKCVESNEHEDCMCTWWGPLSLGRAGVSHHTTLPNTEQTFWFQEEEEAEFARLLRVKNRPADYPYYCAAYHHSPHPYPPSLLSQKLARSIWLITCYCYSQSLIFIRFSFNLSMCNAFQCLSKFF